MKKLLTVFFVIIILLPMFVYLNPFIWGLRKPPIYKASDKTKELILKLNEKYDLDFSTDTNSDTLWYFIDVRNDRVPKLDNFTLKDFGYYKSQLQTNQNVLKNYADDFLQEFEHKQYFDSIIITKDTLKYKGKIK
ncbi:hypothetical protein [Paenimyroides viscosum]|uniref:Uncharacterized protein n=1 Tax=Paenimyroides viscosum TaxID=2488729 RepID=A0A3P1B8W8_9FLAO|nr:hypothetical protein [Paenimyroides viscosum]RRA97133.1 hypothetical protein EG242_00985 [Paenimyroides viscosum]